MYASADEHSHKTKPQCLPALRCEPKMVTTQREKKERKE
jgi:hypothetical protein